ncbi:MAG: carboxynorspermidine decarboxylase, partial [Ruminococcus sp.]|nr:carboxynorspermidine decarboxylase [Ruminococcus sp.]
EIDELVKISDHIVFNSVSQLYKFSDKCKGVSIGLRINPECSTQDEPIYDPCAPNSRLGVTLSQFDEKVLDIIDGLHFHTLCEQGADALEKTLAAVEEKFGRYLSKLKWVNFGGGHHITRADYDTELLIELIRGFRQKYGVDVYLEPGEAIALNAGYLVTEVMEIVHNGMDIALLDASAACHMPDVLEMPYRPPLFLSEKSGVKKYTYRLSSRTCLAGDIIGDYSFDTELEEGDRLCFEDMAIYSMVKNNTFNGMPLPDIAILHNDGSYEIVKRFGYNDFKERLS